MIWSLMILLGVIAGILNGTMEEVGNGALEAAGSAVTLCITMTGILSMWTGLMQVARASGLLEKMAAGLAPVLRFLFPRLGAGSKAAEYIATNMVANVLGLGWAATPAGLMAMEELAVIEGERGTAGYESECRMTGYEGEQGTAGYEGERWGKENGSRSKTERAASDEMCTLLVLNMSSLQLIPINMIAYRSQYGSTSPAQIMMPVIVSTLISTMVAVIYCKLRQRKSI